jgi:hypothetical protein
MTDLPIATTMTVDKSQAETVDQMIARVLARAHRQMQAQDAPSEARAILHVAHSFADELSTLDPGFDRTRFVEDVTEDPSVP